MKLIIADGELTPVGFGTPDFEEPLKVSVPFTPNADASDADTADKVYLAVLEPDSNKALLSVPAQRNDGVVSITLPNVWSGMEVHVYGFVIGNGRDNLGVIASSQFIGTGNVG